MSTTEMSSAAAIKAAKARHTALKLEVVVIPVADVERAKRFYGGLGWRLDGEFVKGEGFHAVQYTPPGSPTSIHFGKGLTAAKPGSADGLYLVVSDILATRAELIAHGVEVSEIGHRAGPGEPLLSGPHPQRGSYGSYATFSDPDGNQWLLQEVTARFPGRVATDEVTFTSSSELASALRRASLAHGEHEKRYPGQPHQDEWPDWYSQYIVAEQTGQPLPT